MWVKLKKISWKLIVLLILVVATSGCGSNGPDEDISAGEVYNESYPVIINYDTSKHEDTPKIPIKGKVLFFDQDYLLELQYLSDNENVATPLNPQKIDLHKAFLSSESLFSDSSGTSLKDRYPNTFLDIDEFPRNTTITFFVPVKVERVYVGNWGENTKGYRLITDVLVLYWPEKEIAGWHRVYGLNPKTFELVISTPPSEIYGDNQVDEWILSLPIQ
jgi:hypothetical protein